MATRICVVCGASFQLKPYYPYARKTCSNRCRYKALGDRFRDETKHTTRICVYCGKAFDALTTSTKKLCSQACKQAYVGKVLSGQNNPNWKPTKQLRPSNKRSLRRHIADRDKVCQDCGSDKKLQVHHKDCDPTNNADDNLVLLCKHCHAQRHQNMGQTNLAGLILVNRTYSSIPPRQCIVCGTTFAPKRKSMICCSPQCGRAASGRTRSK